MQKTLENLHDRIDQLEKALYRACSDVYSLRYPNGNKDVEDLYKQYLNESEDTK